MDFILLDIPDDSNIHMIRPICLHQYGQHRLEKLAGFGIVQIVQDQGYIIEHRGAAGMV